MWTLTGKYGWHNYDKDMYTNLGVVYHTGFPLKEKALPSGYVGDFILMAPSRVLLHSIQQFKWTITTMSGATYCTAVVSSNGVFPFLDSNNEVVGYVRIDNHQPIYKVYDIEILDNVSYYIRKPTTGTAHFVDTEKYVPKLEGTELSFHQAIYCGENLEGAITRVNGATGPTIEFTTKGYIYLKPELIFDSYLPDVLCERDGIKGPTGPKGPPGPNGRDGRDAVQVLMEFEDVCL